MSRSSFTLFVGNLPFSASEGDLKKDFSDCGPIVKVSLPLNASGKPRGFAFIEMKDNSGMQKALKFNETDYGGRTISVRESVDRQQKGKRESQPSNTLFIGGLSSDLAPDDLRSAFEVFGDISGIRIPTDRDTGEARGIAFVEFTSVDAAKKAMQKMDGKNLGNRKIRLDFAAVRDRDQGSTDMKGGSDTRRSNFQTKQRIKMVSSSDDDADPHLKDTKTQLIKDDAEAESGEYYYSSNEEDTSEKTTSSTKKKDHSKIAQADPVVQADDEEEYYSEDQVVDTLGGKKKTGGVEAKEQAVESSEDDEYYSDADDEQPTKTKSKTSAKAVKKVGESSEDDEYYSDADDEQPTKTESKASAKAVKKESEASEDDEYYSDEDDEQPAKTQPKTSATVVKKKKEMVESSEEEYYTGEGDEQPVKTKVKEAPRKVFVESSDDEYSTDTEDEQSIPTSKDFGIKSVDEGNTILVSEKAKKASDGQTRRKKIVGEKAVLETVTPKKRKGSSKSAKTDQFEGNTATNSSSPRVSTKHNITHATTRAHKVKKQLNGDQLTKTVTPSKLRKKNKVQVENSFSKRVVEANINRSLQKRPKDLKKTSQRRHRK